MKPELLPTIAVALCLVTAGCGGFLPAPESTPTDGNGAATTPAETAPNGDQSGERDVEFDRPRIQPGEALGNYTALYDTTIESVVEIRAQTTRGEALGSGFVYHDDGYIVTNQHVVADTDEVSVGFASGVWHTGEVIGTDVYTDLAVIQVDSLPERADPMPLAERSPEPGQPVVALGSPLGFEGSITQGIVSGVNRSMPVAQGYSIPDTVQTDAAINPGNSGGPLVAMNGAVVGVNRAKAGDNVGFAISAAVVERVVPELIERGRYRHAYLGIATTPVTPDLAEANDLDSIRGMVVVDVRAGAPADGVFQPAERQAGPDGEPILVGDVIVGIGGQPVTNQHDLARYLLLETQPGEQIQMTVVRDGERVTETITLGDRPAPTTQRGV